MEDFRIGDAERQHALSALGVHMREGRLDIEEYSDRAAKVAAARTRAEVTPLFTDLPEPRPEFMPVRVERRTGGGLSRRTVVPAIGVVWVLALFLGLELRLIWLIPIALVVTIVLNAMGNRR